MKSKAQNIVAWTLTGIAGLMVIASGIFKLSAPPAVVDGLTKLGVGSYIALLGSMEIAFAVLFLIPRTTKIGFLLITAYFAGATATELSHGNSIASPVVILVLVWIAAFLKKPEIFIDQKRTVNN